jgi:hypothetical protein
MMKLIIAFSIPFAIGVAVAGCNQSNNKTTNMDKKDTTGNQTSIVDTIPKVTGIGGIFFYSDNLEETKEWYAKNLGIEINDWGSSGFESRNINRPDEINSLQWKPFKKGDEYFGH